MVLYAGPENHIERLFHLEQAPKTQPKSLHIKGFSVFHINDDPKVTVPVGIKNVLRDHGVCRCAAIVHHLWNDHDISVTPESLRVRLTKLVKHGEVLRPAYGSYCLPGREPKKGPNLAEWVSEEVQRFYPSAHNPASLRKRYKREHQIAAPSFEAIELELRALRTRGLVVHKGQGCYAWSEPPVLKP